MGGLTNSKYIFKHCNLQYEGNTILKQILTLFTKDTFLLIQKICILIVINL